MRWLLLPAVLLALALPAAAGAHEPGEIGETTVTTTGPRGPSPEQVEVVERIARDYWKVTSPPCGHPGLYVSVLPLREGGQADVVNCTIDVNSALEWLTLPVLFCRVYVHEYGHLVLGLSHFAASNPADASHSPDPANIMFGGVGQTWQQAEAQAAAAGCMGPPKVEGQRAQSRSGANVAVARKRGKLRSKRR